MNPQLMLPDTRHPYKPLVINNSLDHSMGGSLYTYIDIKMHHLIKENDYNEIRVIGEYDRSCSISRYEKKGKNSNWQRPTAEVIDDILFLKCFPGVDYVQHYAALVASYLSLSKRNNKNVNFFLPTDDECWLAVENIGLNHVPKSDILVIGYGMHVIADTNDWSGNSQILWHQKRTGGHTVTYLIVQFSYWGDILRRIVNVLANRGFDTIIFTAKVGAINSNLIPNQTIVTGSSSLLSGEMFSWNNIFDSEKLEINDCKHVNSTSVLFEDVEWVKSMRYFDLVDSEIGECAKGAAENNMRFGYLHFVSNSLTDQCNEDLSNERDEKVLDKRAKMLLLLRGMINQTIKNL